MIPIPAVRREALRALSRMGTRGAAALLLGQLASEPAGSGPEREALLSAIGGLSSPEAVPSLLGELDSSTDPCCGGRSSIVGPDRRPASVRGAPRRGGGGKRSAVRIQAIRGWDASATSIAGGAQRSSRSSDRRSVAAPWMRSSSSGRVPLARYCPGRPGGPWDPCGRAETPWALPRRVPRWSGTAVLRYVGEVHPGYRVRVRIAAPLSTGEERVREQAADDVVADGRAAALSAGSQATPWTPR